MSPLASIGSLLKPQYVLRPRQLLRRLSIAAGRGPRSEFANLMLPWGLPIRCRPAEHIGGSLAKLGVFDLQVTEVIWRLLDRDEVGVDAGANIGYMSSAMLRRVGPSGLVIAFEPLSEIRQELLHNAETWASKGNGRIVVYDQVLSDVSGEEALELPLDWSDNRGTARLAHREEHGGSEAVRRQPVTLATLDQVLSQAVPDHLSIGLLKVDVESHELELFRGARQTLLDRRIRDIVYEDHRGLDSQASELLRSHGYTIFGLEPSGWAGVRLIDKSPTKSSDYLATIDPSRAVNRFRRRGWRVLAVAVY